MTGGISHIRTDRKIQNSTDMNKEIKTRLYTSPEISVIEAEAQQVICSSKDGNIAAMGWGDEQGNNNWN